MNPQLVACLRTVAPFVIRKLSQPIGAVNFAGRGGLGKPWVSQAFPWLPKKTIGTSLSPSSASWDDLSLHQRDRRQHLPRQPRRWMQLVLGPPATVLGPPPAPPGHVHIHPQALSPSKPA